MRKSAWIAASVFSVGAALFFVTSVRADAGRSWMEPFGIELGAPLPATVRHQGTKWLPGMDAGAFALQYIEATPPEPPSLSPPPSGPVEYPWGYSIFATPTSKTVYRVDARLPYKGESECKDAARNFAENMASEASEADGGDWEKGRIGILRDITVFAGVIGGRKTGAYDGKRPLILKDVGALADSKGVRMILACGDGSMILTLIHLPSQELRIAEAFQASKVLMELYASGDRDAPPQMSPFGLRLGKPLPEAVRIRRQETRSGDDSPAVYEVRPPEPHDLFWRYEAIVTPMTESLVALTAFRAVKGRDECRESLDNVAKPLAEAFRQPAPKWYRQTTFDFIHAHLKPDPSVSKILPLQVNVYCEPSGMKDWPDWSREFGPKAQGLQWRGFVQFEMFDLNTLVDMERELMNPEGEW